ncbi:MAG: nucleoside hydrolase [Ruminococcaceae bacterium]|nr:nucleoside hydrolase [Oscillospiraceae bacterium]
MEKILLDTDIGCDMDDMQALAYLLARDDVKLLGITTVTGEPIVRAKLADMMCRLAGRNIPIHSGAGEALNGKFRQGGVIKKEKALLDEFPHREDFAEETAVEFLRETIEAHPREITLCAIGPLTNLARLFTKYPHIPHLIKTLVIMGGRFGDVDTARWGEQEWNIINDPEAARIVFDAPVTDVRVFGVELTNRVFRTDTETLSDECAKIPSLLPFSKVIRTSREAWYHDVVAVSALFCDDGMEFARGRICVSEAGDTHFTPDKQGNHLLMTAMDIGKFFAHYNQTVGIKK